MQMVSVLQILFSKYLSIGPNFKMQMLCLGKQDPLSYSGPHPHHPTFYISFYFSILHLPQISKSINLVHFVICHNLSLKVAQFGNGRFSVTTFSFHHHRRRSRSPRCTTRLASQPVRQDVGIKRSPIFPLTDPKVTTRVFT